MDKDLNPVLLAAQMNGREFDKRKGQRATIPYTGFCADMILRHWAGRVLLISIAMIAFIIGVALMINRYEHRQEFKEKMLTHNQAMAKAMVKP